MPKKEVSAASARAYKPLVPMNETLLVSHKDVDVTVCADCGRILRLKQWSRAELGPEIERLIEKQLVFNQKADVSVIDIDPQLGETIPKRGTAKVYVEGKIDKEKLFEEYEVPYRIHQQQCSLCAKNNEIYYEGTIQLRNITPEMLEYTLNFIKTLTDRGVFANKVTPGGERDYDIRISNQRFIKVIGLELQRVFGGTIQNDAKLFSYNKQTSRNVYRVNVTYTAYGFAKHSIIINEQEQPFYVESIQKKAHLRSILTNELSAIDAIQARKYTQLKAVKVTISRHLPTTQALHPETFQETPIEYIGVEPVDAKHKSVKVYVVGKRLLCTGY
ncbi:MAG TPA: NMD3-related protein [Acidobacteriota bacterium]|nr:NMD3-related protein [Acidobacteriota bacterium]